MAGEATMQRSGAQANAQARTGEAAATKVGRRGFLAASGAALLLGACSDNITQIFNCPDAGPARDAKAPDKQIPDKQTPDRQVPDMGKDAGMDKGVQDSLKPDACVKNSFQPDCSNTSVLAVGAVAFKTRLGKPIDLAIDCKPIELLDHTGNTVYKVYMTGYQSSAGMLEAVVTITDSCGAPLKKDKIFQGATNQLMLNGMPLRITADGVDGGTALDGTAWGIAKLTIKLPCNLDAGVPDMKVAPDTMAPDTAPSKYWCLEGYGILDQGCELSMPNVPFTVSHDDLVVMPGKLYGAVSFHDKNGQPKYLKDASGNMVNKAKIEEGTAQAFSDGTQEYKVAVPVVTPGYTFGSKWFLAQVYSANSGQCKPAPDAGLTQTIKCQPCADGGVGKG